MPSGPFRSGPDNAGQGASDPEISVGGYFLRIGPRQIPLSSEEMLVGRGEECDVVISGALVSRRHARIFFDDGEPCVEDLGSMNGTFVNGARLQGRVPIRPGDHIFVGSFDIQFLWIGSEPPESGVKADDRATPPSGVSVATTLATSRESDHWGAVTERGRLADLFDLETIESAGRLAERMFGLGRPLAARDILSGPLKLVLEATRAGQAVQSEVLDAAGHHAMKLAYEACDANWMNLAVEIHVLADHPMRAETLEQVIDLRSKAPVGDDSLIRQLHEQMQKQTATMALGERMLLSDLAALIPPADDDG